MDKNLSKLKDNLIGNVQATMNDFQTEVEALEEENRELKTRVNELAEQVESLEEENTSLKNQVYDLQNPANNY